MPSLIDPTKPVTGTPTTASVRDNFAAAKTEIEANQADILTKIGSSVPGAADFPAQVAPAFLEGRVWYDADKFALSYYNDVSESSMQIGFESWIRVRNQTGATIPDGSVVYISGATGQLPTITLAQANSPTAHNVIGLVTAAILNNGIGHVTISGTVHNQDTSAFLDGDILYLSATVPGGLTNIMPANPNHIIAIGICAYAHATQGKILVSIRRICNEASNIWFTPTASILSGTVQAAIEEVDAKVGGAKILQIQNFVTGAYSNTNTIIPLDDTIPQQTEGSQLMSLAITPLSATSNLHIDIHVLASSYSDINNIFALFRDATASAIAVSASGLAANHLFKLTLSAVVPSNSTALTTFKLRAGNNTGVAIYFNGESGARRFGGVANSSIKITEIEP